MDQYCFQTNSFARASQFYSISDKKLSEVFTKMIVPPQDDAKKGLISYLDKILFDPQVISKILALHVTLVQMADLVDETPELADKIIQYYHLQQPQKLCRWVGTWSAFVDTYNSIVFESCLSYFSPTKTIAVLEAVNLNSRDQFLRFELCAIEFVLTILKRAFLYWKLGQYDKSMKDILSLDPNALIEFFLSNTKFCSLESMGTHLIHYCSYIDMCLARDSSLAQLLRICVPFTMLEIITR